MSDDGGEPSIEDDILLSLPGSAGYDADGTIAGKHGEAPANGNALGLYVPIEHPRDGDALAHFYQALHELEAGKRESGKVRSLVYGAPHTQPDVYPGYFRVYLQSRFGDGGFGPLPGYQRQIGARGAAGQPGNAVAGCVQQVQPGVSRSRPTRRPLTKAR